MTDPDFAAEGKAVNDAHWRETPAYIAMMGVKRGYALGRAARDAAYLERDCLRAAIKKLLPIGDASKPGNAVFPIYVRMSELRALHEMVALSDDAQRAGLPCPENPTSTEGN